ncbi:methyltransferase domain-containing protein [candidate division KSB1 bacterium]|nr:methyltransferase domain-containing protein [candidate division KSB1 bacterium]
MNTLLYRWLGVLRCPQCRGHFEITAGPRLQALRCLECFAEYLVADGILRLVISGRAKAVEKFCEKYDALRLREGWASEVPEFYLRLPFRDLTGRHDREWQMRAQSFRLVQNWLAQEFCGRRLRVLDAGAGSGWMSRCLAERHEVVAIDVNAGPHGLAALSSEQRCFMAIQAELDRPPFASNSFDVVIANASLHYARGVERFFEKIERVLRPGGKLIVMDSPTYPTREAAHAAHARSREYYAQMGVPELAENYGGLPAALFAEQKAFRFARVRRDFASLALVKKWLREKFGQPVAARFPVWIGERLPRPEEKWQPGRHRAGALLIHQDKLLTYHVQGETKHYWRIPGGGIEPDETPEQAARRELQEELGLEVSLQRLFGPYWRPHAKGEWYFLAETAPEKLPAENAGGFEHACTVQWLPLEKLAEFDIRPPALKWELVEYFNTQCVIRKT